MQSTTTVGNQVMTKEKKEDSSRQSLWWDVYKRVKKDKMAMASITIIAIYFLIALLCFLGVLGADWAKEVGPSYAPPGSDYLFGTDFLGRDVLAKLIYGVKVAFSVGLFSACISIPIGITLGALAGYFGGVVDEIIVWFYSTVSSIPSIMLLMGISLAVGKGLFAVYMALGLTSWVTLSRLIRGEVIKHKDREYVQAATSIGGGHFRKLFRHILPNVMHIVIIDFSLQFQNAIKAEVILSYLGIGVQGVPSWGTMIDDAKNVWMSKGVWWEMAGATAFMFVLVLAFNIMGDALRDALDPKLRGK